MKIFVIFLGLLVAVTAQTEFPDFDEAPPGNFDVGTALLTSILGSEPVQNKLKIIFEIFDLKIRFIKLAAQVLTRHNLVLFRNFLDFVSRLCTFLMKFLPESEGETGATFLEALFPVVGLASPENPVNRVDRQAGNLTSFDEELLEKHKDEVDLVTKLIYNVP
ncbi:uncharacterized protein LOC658802 [Tribolium castaneum]|uniref:Uncharacterized protein n=1 Tax=Tribolium castaneum TaxID=7070 RepID=D2A5K6_TRICA|nr:PREDICTED: uncharacterized protein LOC658802 [Tribolium castaneum]EFA05061.1 hypothetical protein TcasGA2_TC015156 [Tribolium castaneum]|eukprot:XP_976295.1 PREDICTED: uncharacterized protein LOC658802 [Tribolium castaneum]